MKIEIDSNILKSLFQNVYFINGTAYAGKSTILKMLADKYDGILCRENYHLDLYDTLDELEQPNLCYFKTMSSWQDFLNRTPEEYDKWIQNTSLESVQLEVIEILRHTTSGKKIFVDTNIPASILHQIASYHQVCIMVNPQSMSVERFFERDDAEKQFLLSKINEAVDPQKTLQNFKDCIAKINDESHYQAFLNSGFYVFHRDDSLSLEETLCIIETHFKLQ